MKGIRLVQDAGEEFEEETFGYVMERGGQVIKNSFGGYDIHLTPKGLKTDYDALTTIIHGLFHIKSSVLKGNMGEEAAAKMVELASAKRWGHKPK